MEEEKNLSNAPQPSASLPPKPDLLTEQSQSAKVTGLSGQLT